MNKRDLLKLMLICSLLMSIHIVRASNDTILNDVQQRIYNTFLSCFQTNSPDNLLTLESALSDSKFSPMRNYWIAYTGYYKTLFYLKTGKREESSMALEKAITVIDTVKNKNSELYALTAFLQSFSMQYNKGNAQELFSKINQNAEKALELDSTNVRVWYILGNNDMYVPAAFGGGRKCEKYFLKAISLPEQSIPDKTMPSWGKSEAFSALVGYYIGNENFYNAKKYLSEGLVLYPDDYMLNQHKETLKDK
jgi:tetratricopeptide (TPR) repeat protein